MSTVANTKERNLLLDKYWQLQTRLENLGKREPMINEYQYSVTMYNLVKAIVALENKLWPL